MGKLRYRNPIFLPVNFEIAPTPTICAIGRCDPVISPKTDNSHLPYSSFEIRNGCDSCEVSRYGENSPRTKTSSSTAWQSPKCGESAKNHPSRKSSVRLIIPYVKTEIASTGLGWKTASLDLARSPLISRVVTKNEIPHPLNAIGPKLRAKSAR